MYLKRLKIWSMAIVIGVLPIGSAFGQSGWDPIHLYHRVMPNGVAIASYHQIKINDFRKILMDAFEASGFSFMDVATTKDEYSKYRFSYPVSSKGKSDAILLVLTTDEKVDRSGRCTTCFLRRVDLPNLLDIKGSPWMIQYDAGHRIYTGIDQAFEKIRVDGKKYMDESFGFNYTNLWQKERNVLGNSFTVVSPQELKSATIDAYRAAGFIFVDEKQKKLTVDGSELKFIFPIDPEQTAGVAYAVTFFSQLDREGACHPCEMDESFDPYQTLPAAGLSGMAKRLTLESRFASARMLAYEKLKGVTERYLRPRSVFTIPVRSVPLGSPRPPRMPVAVT